MFKLIPTADGRFDLAFDDPALDDANAAAATVIYAELHTDAAAPLGRVDKRFDRRGWWADPTAGTGLWHVRRQPLDANARRETVNDLKRRLGTRDPAFADIEVAEVESTLPAGNVSSVFVEITGSHNGRKFIVRAPL